MGVALRERTGRNTEVPDGLSVSLHHLTRRPTMADKDLKALFLHQLKDTYFAENCYSQSPAANGRSRTG